MYRGLDLRMRAARLDAHGFNRVDLQFLLFSFMQQLKSLLNIVHIVPRCRSKLGIGHFTVESPC
jgi:hypothetical protein